MGEEERHREGAQAGVVGEGAEVGGGEVTQEGAEVAAERHKECKGV